MTAVVPGDIQGRTALVQHSTGIHVSSVRITICTAMGLNQNLFFAKIAQQALGCNLKVQSHRGAATNNIIRNGEQDGKPRSGQSSEPIFRFSVSTHARSRESFIGSQATP